MIQGIPCYSVNILKKFSLINCSIKNPMLTLHNTTKVLPYISKIAK